MCVYKKYICVNLKKFKNFHKNFHKALYEILLKNIKNALYSTTEQLI